MKEKINYYGESIKVLQDLHKLFPNFALGLHLSTATSELGDLWAVSDRELFHALSKYKTEIELDKEHITDDKFVDKVIEDGKKLFDTNKDDLSDLDMKEEGEDDGY